MQKRLRTALVPAIAIATLALGAAQFGTGDAVAAPKRLDKPDAKRPAAASQLAELAPYGIAQASAESAIGAAVVEQQRQVQTWMAEAARHEAEQAAAAAQSSYAGGGSRGGGSGSTGSSGNFLECTKSIESGGDYGAVSSGGTYRGAYQFQQSTWNNTAASAGRDDLVGVDPATVAPTDQDAMASQLYSAQGNAPWGGRC
jgi:Transglycosylase-like domain